MPKFKIFALLGLLLFTAAVVSACASQTTVAAEGVPVALQEEGSPTPVVSSPSTLQAETGEALPTEEAVDYCLDCHTDQQMLIDTASEEEEVINENKGEG